jgi:geranylgeranyl reductase family protein
MAAWAAARKGLTSILIDRSSFPRDKVCGDAIPYETYKLLEIFDPQAHQELLKSSSSQLIRKARVHTPNGRHATIQWNTRAVNSRRMDFDDWLLSKALQNAEVEMRSAVRLKKFTRTNVWEIDLGEEKITSSWLLGAGGAHCPVARQLANKRTDKKHHLAAIRTYWEGLPDLDPLTNELYTTHELSPGYVWIFPLPNGMANVGFGMLSQTVANRKIDLKKSFLDYLQNGPLKDRFAEAKMIGSLSGFDLPLGSKTPELYGDDWMLCGDAASLIDPLDGHGIGAAMWSGYLAIDAISDIQESRNSKQDALEHYAKELDRRFYKKFRLHRKIIGAARFPFLLNLISRPRLLNLAGFRTVDD